MNMLETTYLKIIGKCMKNRQYVQLLYIGVALLTFSPFYITDLLVLIGTHMHQ